MERKLQTLVFDILPSTAVVFSYVTGSRKLSANEQFFCWCSNSSKFVTNSSDYIRHLFYVAMLLTPAQINPNSFESRRNCLFFFFFLTRGWCVSCLRACLGASLLPQSYLSEGADRVGEQPRGNKKCPFSGITKSGRVWRKVQESDARSVRSTHTPSIAFRHLPPNSARFSYATEGALFTSAQLSTDAVSALRKIWVLIRLWKQTSAQFVSRFGLAVRRYAGKRKDLDSNPLRLSFLFKSCGLWILSCDFVPHN